MVVDTNTSFIPREDLPGLGKDYGLVFIAENEKKIFATLDGQNVSVLKKQEYDSFRNLYFDETNQFSSHQEELYYSLGTSLFGLKKGLIKKFENNVKGITRFKTKLLAGQSEYFILCADDNSAVIDGFEYSRDDLVATGGNLFSMNNYRIINSLNNKVVHETIDGGINCFVGLEGKLYFSDSYSIIEGKSGSSRYDYNVSCASKKHNDLKVFDGKKVSDFAELEFRPYSMGVVNDSSSGNNFLFGPTNEKGMIVYNLDKNSFASILETSGISEISSIAQVPISFLKSCLK